MVLRPATLEDVPTWKAELKWPSQMTTVQILNRLALESLYDAE